MTTEKYKKLTGLIETLRAEGKLDIDPLPKNCRQHIPGKDKCLICVFANMYDIKFNCPVVTEMGFCPYEKDGWKV